MQTWHPIMTELANAKTHDAAVDALHRAAEAQLTTTQIRGVASRAVLAAMQSTREVGG